MSNKFKTYANRIAYIMERLNNGDVLHLKDLSLECAVSIRTLQKDLNERLSNHLPIIRGKDGTYYLEEFAQGKLKYDDLRYFAQQSGVEKLFPTLEDGFLSEVLTKNKESSLLVKGANFEDIAKRREEFDIIRLAILIRHQLKFTYNDKQRLLNPYKLVNNDAIWYLIGEEEGNLKTFSFSKITHLKETQTKFTPKREVLEIIYNRGSKWFAKDKIVAIIEVDASVAEYFLRRDLLPEQSTIKQTKKKLILKTKVAYKEELLKIVKYWIPYLKIIEPAYLDEALREELFTYLHN